MVDRERRVAALDEKLAFAASRGYRVETRSEFQATVVKGHRVNHVLHLLISVLTIGVWVLVWIGLSVRGGERRVLVTVDEQGSVVNRVIS